MKTSHSNGGGTRWHLTLILTVSLVVSGLWGGFVQADSAEATFIGLTGRLSVPCVEIGVSHYNVEMALLDADLRFELLLDSLFVVEELDNCAHFNGANGKLTIPVVLVEGSAYRIDMALVSHAPIVFQVQSITETTAPAYNDPTGDDTAADDSTDSDDSDSDAADDVAPYGDTSKDHLRQITNSEQFEALFEETRPVMIAFGNDTSGTSQGVGAIMEALAVEMDGEAIFAEADIDALDTVFWSHWSDPMAETISLPGIFIIYGGKIVQEASGFQKESDLRALLEACDSPSSSESDGDADDSGAADDADTDSDEGDEEDTENSGVASLENLLQERFNRPEESSSPTTYLHILSTAGDYIGQGKRYEYNDSGVMTFRQFSEGLIDIDVDDGDDDWNLSIAPPDGELLDTGFYEDAKRYPFNDNSPGLSFSGNGRGSNELWAEFYVWELELDGDEISRLAIDFVMRNEETGPPLSGMLRINSSLK